MATVLLVTNQGVITYDNVDQVKVTVNLKVTRTGEACIEDGAEFILNLKALGLYKLPAVLNADLMTAVQDYVLSTYSLSTFNATYMTGGFVPV